MLPYPKLENRLSRSMPPITALQTRFRCEKREQRAFLHFFLYFIQGRKTSGVRLHLTNQRNLPGVVVTLLKVQKIRHLRANAKVYVNHETNNLVLFVKNLSYISLPRKKHKSMVGLLIRLRPIVRSINILFYSLERNNNVSLKRQWNSKICYTTHTTWTVLR